MPAAITEIFYRPDALLDTQPTLTQQQYPFNDLCLVPER